MRTLVLFLSITSCLSMSCQQIRTVYNDHSCCRDSPTDTCLRTMTMPVCNETSNTSICTEAGIPTIKVDNTTIFLNENGTLYTTSSGGDSTNISVDDKTIKQYDNGTIYAVGGSSSASTTNIAVDNTTIKQYDNGTIYAVGGSSGSSATSTAVVTRDGQVLEELVGICDGRSVTVSSGTYTLTDVTARHDTTNSWTTLPGTEISYKPPTGTTQVIYIFSMVTQSTNTHLIAGLRFFIDNVEVKNLPNIASTYEGGYHEPHHIKFVIDIGSNDVANGKVGSWTTAKTLKIKVKGYSDHTTHTYHASFFENYWDMNDNSATTYIVKPILNIRAIGVQLNYVNFEPTPSALLGAQTFEVSQADCASTALRTSIHAQFTTAFPNQPIGTQPYFSGSTATLPNGCVFYVDTHSTAYTRIGFNNNAADPDDALGSGYSTASFTLRICKYANGDFVLLTDPTAKCKTVHFTLPDNLNTLADVLQTDSTKLGIGIAPEASFHIGLSENVDVNVSRFECDGTGAIIEQTSGKVTEIMSREDCSKLTNFESGVVLPGTTAVKYYDGTCSTGDSYQPYKSHVIVIDRGSHPGGDTHLTFAECKTYALSTSGFSWATDSGNDAGTYSHTLNPPGCQSYGSTNLVYYNTNLQSTTGCDTTQKCISKLNVKLVASGTNTGSEALSEGECMAWGTLSGRWNRHLSISSLPPGCMQNGPGLGGTYDHNAASIYWNSGSGSCSDSRYCVMRDTSLDNTGSNNQFRVNNCRDRCSDPSSKIWNGLTYGLLPYHTTPTSTPASFSVEPTGGECTCHAEPAATCQRTASDFVDLYQLNWRPKGCFLDTSTNTHYHTDVDGGVCSDYFKCYRTDDACLVQDQTNETKSISLISEQSAWFKNEIIVSSDQRIKTNITHVDNALSILRDIPTRYYDYVDHRRGSSTIGFLAQEVAQVLPSAVKKQKGYIPSHMKRITCVFNYTDALRIHCPELDDDKKYKLYVSNPDEGEKVVEIRNHGVIDKVYTSIYCFGEEVEDFHVLEKSKLFAIAFSATQELDKVVSTLRQEVDALKAKVYN